MTPEKKHFKFNEVDSPDVIPLTQFLTNEDDEEEVDVWDESWVRNRTVDEQKNERVSAGSGVYSIAEAWEWQRQLKRPFENDDCVIGRLYCDLCSRSGMTGIRIPNSQYEHRLRYSTDWYHSDFITGC